MKILLLSKTTEWCRAAQRLLIAHGTDVDIIEGERETPLPEQILKWNGDYIISYLCPWIIPASVLVKVRKAAINFHPAPPEYPGIGCYNFALYNGEREYGATCHYMDSKVDSGSIIKVTRFSILPNDTVETLKDRTMACMFMVYSDVLGFILKNISLPNSNDRWTRVPYTRQELDDLCKLTPSMGPEEIQRRIRATTYPGVPSDFLGGRPPLGF